MIEYRKYIEGEVTSHKVGEYGGRAITDGMRNRMLNHMSSDTEINSSTREINNLALDSMIETGVLWSRIAAGNGRFLGYSRLGAHKRVLPLSTRGLVEELKSLEIVMPILELFTSWDKTHALLMVNKETGEKSIRNIFLTNMFSSREMLSLPTGDTVEGLRLCLGSDLEHKATREIKNSRYGQLGLINDLLGARPNADLPLIGKVAPSKLQEYLVDLAKKGVITTESLREMYSEQAELVKKMPRISSNSGAGNIMFLYEINLLTLHLLGKYLPFDVAADAPFHIMTLDSSEEARVWGSVATTITRAIDEIEKDESGATQ